MSQKSVLFVAHPAHELLVHHWMEQARPCVLILTDGTGSSGPSRIASSRDNILNTGARPGSLFGDYTDADIYRHILDRDVAFFAGILDRVVATLVDEDADLLVSDPVEHYSPAHDLCAAIAAIARAKAAAQLRHPVVYRQFPIEYRTNLQGVPVILGLEPEAISRKLAAAHRVPGVAEERARLLALDPEMLASEILWDVAPDRAPLPAPDSEPFYEHYGRMRMQQGLFNQLITYRHQLRPLINALTAV